MSLESMIEIMKEREAAFREEEAYQQEDKYRKSQIEEKQDTLGGIFDIKSFTDECPELVLTVNIKSINDLYYFVINDLENLLLKKEYTFLYVRCPIISGIEERFESFDSNRISSSSNLGKCIEDEIDEFYEKLIEVKNDIYSFNRNLQKLYFSDSAKLHNKSTTHYLTNTNSLEIQKMLNKMDYYFHHIDALEKNSTYSHITEEENILGFKEFLFNSKMEIVNNLFRKLTSYQKEGIISRLYNGAEDFSENLCEFIEKYDLSKSICYIIEIPFEHSLSLLLFSNILEKLHTQIKYQQALVIFLTKDDSLEKYFSKFFNFTECTIGSLYAIKFDMNGNEY